jgi:hypothetical protein
MGLGRYCTCPAFIRPSPRQQRSANYRRPSFTRERAGDREIGSGGGSYTANLQDSQLLRFGNQKRDRNEVPEWVMFGIRKPDGTVEIIASTKLSNLSMRQEGLGEFEKIHADLIESGKLESKPWDLRGRMVGYLSAHARNYVDALRDLMTGGWRPDGDEPDQGPTREQLQLEAALADARRHVVDEVVTVSPEPDENGIYEAEIVEED